MLDSSSSYYVQQQALAALALWQARNSWNRIDPSDITGSWNALIDSLAQVVTAIQFRAAVFSVDYIGNAITEQEIDAPREAKVVESELAGIASDGRNLKGLLDEPRIRTLTRLKFGASIEDALDAGRKSLERIAITQIQDAGRVASGLEIVNRPKVTGYVRMLNPPSCSRCILLAGKRYRWNEGFRRHPHCDCRHVPIAEDQGVPDVVATEVIVPERYFNSLPSTPTYNDKGRRIDQDAIFGKDGARAIRDGADISQVVNARMGMDIAGTYGQKITTAGITKRGLAGQRLRAQYGRNIPDRLMPEAIYQLAENDRVKAMELLYLHGYVL